MVVIEAFLGVFEWTRTVADTVHGVESRNSLLISLNRNRAGFYFHLKRLLGKAAGRGHSRKVCDDESQCVLWSEQTRRAGHGWVVALERLARESIESETRLQNVCVHMSHAQKTTLKRARPVRKPTSSIPKMASLYSKNHTLLTCVTETGSRVGA